MTVLHLILREVRFRKTGFILGLLAVALPVAVYVGSRGLLASYEQTSDQLMEGSEEASEQRWAEYKDSMRKTMKRLGFNLLILPEGHTASDPDAEQLVLPEYYATQLAERESELINHVLPFLERRYEWKERDRWVRLFGTEGEVYIKASWQAPIQEDVARGTIALGHNVHTELGIEAGDTVTLAGKDFVVEATYPPRSVEDDERVWMHVAEAQAILGEDGHISGMLALSCNCAGKDVALIENEVAGILPGTKVLAETSALVTRLDARSDAQEEALLELRAEANKHAELRGQREQFATVLLPLVLAGSFLTVGVLAWFNVRDRREEIGVFRAIGYTRQRILGIFLGKAVMLGVVGGLMGMAVAVPLILSRTSVFTPVDWSWALLAALLGAPAFAIFATLVPATLAAAQDPVEVIREN
ncbi:MAG: ABC transporter permease [Opitutales bacterium]